MAGNGTSEAQVGADLARQGSEPKVYRPGGLRELGFVLADNGNGGIEVQPLEVYVRASEDGPQGKKHSSLFRAVVVIDDHSKDGGPAWRDFRGILVPPTSESYRHWMGQNGEAFKGNEEFAEFLEDSFVEIVEPDGATMLELANNFHVKQEVTFGNPIDLGTGAQQLTINKVVNGSAQSTGKVTIPKKFTIEIPVLRGDARKYRFEAKFRYRLDGNGRLTIWYDFVRPDLVLERVLADAVVAIATGAGDPPVPVLQGAADFKIT